MLGTNIILFVLTKLLYYEYIYTVHLKTDIHSETFFFFLGHKWICIGGHL